MNFGMPLVMSLETKASFTTAELTALLWNRIRPLVDVKNSTGVLLTPVEPPFTLCTVNSTGTIEREARNEKKSRRGEERKRRGRGRYRGDGKRS
jgi:hypothetical protein